MIHIIVNVLKRRLCSWWSETVSKSI